MLPRFFKQSLPSEPRQVVPSEHDHAAPDPEPAALAPPHATSLPAGSLQLADDSMIADGTADSITADPVMAPSADTLAGTATQGVSTAHDESHFVDDSRPDAPRLVSPRRGTVPRKRARRGTSALSVPGTPRISFTPPQRVLLLDTWRRSGLPATDFAPLVGVSTYTLYAWKRRFEQLGPAGLEDQPRGQQLQGSRLPEVTKRTILMLKEAHPEWGCQRISDMLARGPALPASASAVARVLHEADYEPVEQPTRPHPDQPRRFERARPNQMWQTDLFSFVLKRQNRRVYLVAFMDDHSRFVVAYGLHASQSAALVIEVLEAALASYGVPEEILTDNGAQYTTWRGKSQFSRQLEKRGIRHLVSKPRRPQTLGKIERFWGTLWRDCLETAIFIDLADARRRIGLFLDHYNFARPHQGLDGLVPADRFFQAAPEMLQTLRARVASNALELSRHGIPCEPFYLTGQLDGEPFSVHRAGDRLILTRDGQERKEIELAASAQPASGVDVSSWPTPLCPDGSPQAMEGEPASEPPAAPGQSRLDTDAISETAADDEQGGAV